MFVDGLFFVLKRGANDFYRACDKDIQDPPGLRVGLISHAVDPDYIWVDKGGFVV